MNKFLLSFGLVALLAGCDKPAENRMATPQNEMNQPTPTAPATPATPANPATPATPVTPANPVTTTTPEERAVERSVQNQQQAQSAATNTMPPAVTAQPNQSEGGQGVRLNPARTEVIDASSEEAMTASLDRMIVNLSESEKEAFAEAFLVYAMSKVDMSLDEETNQKNMLAALNGKSVQDIMTEAEKIKASSDKAAPPRATQNK